MRKSKFFVLFLLTACAPSAWALYPVHDSVTYIHNTVKAIQDELYQQMDLDYQVEQLGKAGEMLKTSIDTLKVAKDTYSTCKDTYDTAVNISNYIGDPQKLVAYMNQEFWHEDEISAALNITREALSNSLRHAKPRHLTVTLRSDRETVTLEVSDDGMGFDPAAPRRSSETKAMPCSSAA